jgi:hypothetical protein
MEGYEAEPVYKFKLVDCSEVNDLAILPNYSPTLCSHSPIEEEEAPVYKILTANLYNEYYLKSSL